MSVGGKNQRGSTRVRELVPIQDQRELCYDSLGICGKPGCENSLNIRTAANGVLTTVGQRAHIIAAQDDGPRGDPSFPVEQRERYCNLLLLCSKCHLEVDNPANFAVYPAAVLKQWKADCHARRLTAVARSRLHPEIRELGDLLDGLATASPISSDTFERIDLRRKIEVNGLSASVEATIARNIIHEPLVSLQIQLVERIRPNYGELIKTRMSAEWLILSDKHVHGNDAYAALKDMLMFNHGGVGSEGVVDIVLAYFFHLCTILHRE